MIDEYFKRAICGIIASGYQDDSCFETKLNVSDLGHYYTCRVSGETFDMIESPYGWSTSNGFSVLVDNHRPNIMTIVDSQYMCNNNYEFYKINEGVYVVLDINYNLVYSISSVEISETKGGYTIRISTAPGDNYNINPVDNYWISVLVGTSGNTSNVYCIKSDNNSLWICRSRGKTELATATRYPYEHLYRLNFITKGENHSLYRFQNTSLASVSKHVGNLTEEKDVSLSYTAIEDLSTSKRYFREQEGVSVHYR